MLWSFINALYAYKRTLLSPATAAAIACGLQRRRGAGANIPPLSLSTQPHSYHYI